MVGRRDPGEYQEIIAVVKNDPVLNRIRLYPIVGQAFPEDMHIECSKQLRALPIGTKVQIQVVEKIPKNSHDTKHLYSSYKWKYVLIK